MKSPAKPAPAPEGIFADSPAAKKPAVSDSPFAITVGTVYDGPLDLLLDLIRKQDIDIYDPSPSSPSSFLLTLSILRPQTLTKRASLSTPRRC
jgi:segregation and condensation protein A